MLYKEKLVAGSCSCRYMLWALWFAPGWPAAKLQGRRRGRTTPELPKFGRTAIDMLAAHCHKRALTKAVTERDATSKRGMHVALEGEPAP